LVDEGLGSIPARELRPEQIAGFVSDLIDAAVFVTEIGDIHRFPNPARLCSWAGLTPKLRESDAHSHSGHITKQGSRLVRWAAVEAVSNRYCEQRLAAVKIRIAARRGVNYGMRDGEIRCLASDAA
jgi:transposase